MSPRKIPESRVIHNSDINRFSRDITELIIASNRNIAVPDLVRYVLKATNLVKQDLGVSQSLRKRYKINFDPSSVQYKSILLGTTKERAIILKWDSSWGLKPTSKDISSSWREIIKAKGVVRWAHQLAGWTQLDRSEQTILESLLGGETNNLSKTVREKIEKENKPLDKFHPDSQAHLLRNFMTDKTIKPDTVEEPITAEKVGYSFIHQKTIVKGMQFQDRTADAEGYEIKFDDPSPVGDSKNMMDYLSSEQILIFAPKEIEPEYHHHTVQQIADAVSYLPKPNRRTIKSIILNPVPSSKDAYFASKYSIPNLKSTMSADSAGKINVFPTGKTQLVSHHLLKVILLHESGHIWSKQNWGTDTSKDKWLEWKKSDALSYVVPFGKLRAASRREGYSFVTGI